MKKLLKLYAELFEIIPVFVWSQLLSGEHQKLKKLRTSGFHRFYRFRDSDIVQICTTYHSMRNHRLFLKKVTFIFPKTGKKPVKIAKKPVSISKKWPNCEKWPIFYCKEPWIKAREARKEPWIKTREARKEPSIKALEVWLWFELGFGWVWVLVGFGFELGLGLNWIWAWVEFE